MLKTFPAQRLRDFYRDFYRPDRMAVVAVGDFDTERIEALIREHFGTLSAAASGSRTLYPVQLNPGTLGRFRIRTGIIGHARAEAPSAGCEQCRRLPGVAGSRSRLR